MSAETYDGPVVYREGVHYAVDEEGHAILDKPLRWVDGTTYRTALADEPLHAELHHERDVAVSPNEIELHPPGQGEYPAGAHVVSYGDGVYYLLDQYERPLKDNPLRWNRDREVFEKVG